MPDGDVFGHLRQCLGDSFRHFLHQFDVFKRNLRGLQVGDIALDCDDQPLFLPSLCILSNFQAPHVQEVQEMGSISPLVGQDAGEVLSGLDASPDVLSVRHGQVAPLVEEPAISSQNGSCGELRQRHEVGRGPYQRTVLTLRVGHSRREWNVVQNFGNEMVKVHGILAIQSLASGDLVLSFTADTRGDAPLALKLLLGAAKAREHGHGWAEEWHGLNAEIVGIPFSRT
mmetsp:Transcript_14663/g.32172  ORF Transcript_14663/g.32172 Transcript_14663/m.32172 type:complete len:228 (+) Transcript_14663:439-1122(+)